MMPVFQLDGQKYSIETMSPTISKITTDLQAIENRIQENKNLIAVLTKAKRAYISELKTEMISSKAGLDFSDD